MKGFGTLGVAGAVIAAMVASCNVAPQQLGTDAEIGGVLLRNVFVEAPGDGSYQRGDDAVVRFAMLRETDAADVLLAASARACLAVVGSQGKGSVWRALMGSVSHEVVNSSLCPVAVLSPEVSANRS